MESLSARRAWIEIASRRRVSGRALVALRKESVDRNRDAGDCATAETASLSARRAWIEIASSLDDILAGVSRSPQGERG